MQLQNLFKEDFALSEVFLSLKLNRGKINQSCHKKKLVQLFAQ